MVQMRQRRYSDNKNDQEEKIGFSRMTEFGKGCVKDCFGIGVY